MYRGVSTASDRDTRIMECIGVCRCVSERIGAYRQRPMAIHVLWSVSVCIGAVSTSSGFIVREYMYYLCIGSVFGVYRYGCINTA